MPGLAVLVVLALAAFRLTRLVTTDTITGAWRERLYAWTWDDDNLIEVGEDQLEPAPRSTFRTYVHEGLTCPWCFGVWVSAAVYAAWDHGGSVGRTVVAVAAVAGAQGLAVVASSAGDK